MRAAAETMSVEEYIQYELKSERRHEYINGTLYEMPGEKKINNRVAFAVAMLLHQQLFPGYTIYNHDIKVAIPGGQKYYYPDVCASAEVDNKDNEYILYEPVIIIEVVSESNHKYDYVDKFIDYSKIPSLEYYIIAEPDTTFITFHERQGDDWITHQYTKPTIVIELPKLNASLSIADIYKNILPA